MSKTRGIIIGFGNMGALHLARYQTLGIEIVGIIDNDPDKRFKAFENNVRAYVSLDAYLEANQEKPDFVDICLPTHLHYAAIVEVTEKFAAHPIPICVEKPVVRTKAEAIELDALAKQYPAMIFVAECEHYNLPLIQFLRSVPDIAHIDIQRMVNLQYFTLGKKTWLLDEEQSGGLILDLMIHDFSLLERIGGKATKLTSLSCHQQKYHCTDIATIGLQYKNFSAKITGSWLAEDILHPITTTVVITDKSGKEHKLVVNDYLEPKIKDPYLIELAVFLDAIRKNNNPQHLATHTRAVRLANYAMTLISQRRLIAPNDLQHNALHRVPQ